MHGHSPPHTLFHLNYRGGELVLFARELPTPVTLVTGFRGFLVSYRATTPQVQELASYLSDVGSKNPTSHWRHHLGLSHVQVRCLTVPWLHSTAT